jgi:hypothetical protein
MLAYGLGVVVDKPQNRNINKRQKLKTMREIKFRGWTLKDKKEVKGFYFYSMEWSSHMILEYVHCGGNSFDEPPSDHQEAVAVDPKTIGQMFVIDGVEIHEGDLIKEGENTYVVTFLEGRLSLCNILSPAVFVKPVNRQTLRHSEIIGNIHTPTNA